MSNLISKDIAVKEFNKWLDFLEVSESRREGLLVNIGIVVDAMMAGKVTIDHTNGVVTQKLRFPFGKELKVTELKFKTELTVGEIQTYKKGIDFDEENRNQNAAICASTGNLYAIISQMNTRDHNLSAAIVPFFMV